MLHATCRLHGLSVGIDSYSWVIAGPSVDFCHDDVTSLKIPANLNANFFDKVLKKNDNAKICILTREKLEEYHIMIEA